jgi:PAS domain S-box-containing protein
MSWLHDLPIRRKLTLVIMLTCGGVLLLACTVLAACEIFDFRRAVVRETTVLADILGANTQAALAFEDADGARSLLRALQAEPQVVGARLFDADGRPFADFSRAGAVIELPLRPAADGHRFENGHISLFRPVMLEHKRVGTIYLQNSLKGMYDRLRLFGAISGLVLMGAFLLTLALSSWLQRPISGPILELAETSRRIAEQKDYSLRAPRRSDDEVGTLTDAFNHMIAQIHGQNQALKDGEERTRAIMDSALSAVVVIDAAGRVADWNPRAEAMFGWTRAEALGRNLNDIIGVPRAGETANGMAGFFSTTKGPVLHRLIESHALRRDGSDFPVELLISPLKSVGATTYCGFITDITERKHAESRLQAQLSRLDLLNRITRAIGERQDLASIFRVAIRSLEENLPIDFGCVCLYDPVAQVFTLSEIGAHGEAFAETAGLTALRTLPLDASGLAACVHGRLVYQPDVASVQFALREPLLKAGLRSFVAAPMLMESQVSGALITARKDVGAFSSPDCEFLRQVSEHVALASHQAQLYGALQQAYDDLRQTQQAVLQQERLRALGQMASGIAHAINNAISPVSLYTESLLEREPNLTPRGREYLTTIQHAVEDVAQTVSRMREFYRQRETRLTLAPVHLNQVVNQVKDMTRGRWSDMPQQRGVVIEWQTDLEENLPPIMGVESEIREALVNLVFNAADAMPEGGQLTLSTRKYSAAQSVDGEERVPHVEVSVTDTGVGMDEETRRRCLEPFFTTKGDRGTGLGLAMVYGAVQRHSADLRIDSTPGKGTTFTLRFAAPAEASQSANSPRVMELRPDGRLRLLIVDDDPLLIKSLCDTLKGDGHECVVAAGGKMGIETFADARRNGKPCRRHHRSRDAACRRAESGERGEIAFDEHAGDFAHRVGTAARGGRRHSSARRSRAEQTAAAARTARGPGDGAEQVVADGQDVGWVA